MRWYLAITVLASVATFLALWLDKRRAMRGDRRIRERTLHAMELLGGWPGALIAMPIVRHKNRKRSYWIVTAGIACTHVALAAWMLAR